MGAGRTTYVAYRLGFYSNGINLSVEMAFDSDFLYFFC